MGKLLIVWLFLTVGIGPFSSFNGLAKTVELGEVGEIPEVRFVLEFIELKVDKDNEGPVLSCNRSVLLMIASFSVIFCCLDSTHLEVSSFLFFCRLDPGLEFEFEFDWD